MATNLITPNGDINKSILHRFWEKVLIRGPDDCWDWTASCNKTGYGQIQGGERPFLAHRVSWIIHNGPICQAQIVCHKCDNPPCVNPRHLFLGSHQDNSDDKWRKGRQQAYSNMERGEQRHSAVFTEKQVIDIRWRWQFGSTIAGMSREFDVALNTIWQIVHRKRWKHI